MHRFFWVFSVVVLLSACNDDRMIAGEMLSLKGGWNKEQPVVFTIPELDSVQPYNLFLQVRNSNDYPFNNLFLIVSMEFPHGKTVTDTLEYRMSHPTGEWMGSGIGSIKEHKLWYKEGVTFPETGEYLLRIEHALRNNGEVEGVSQLKGITDIGYSIEPAGQ
ncbi:MAG: gliding motility lipoprotein GldH [Flavobacteriaceae bacterium]|nr:gliding motility lipoprotein GldH [Flavobacteriaceae bacterium]